MITACGSSGGKNISRKKGRSNYNDRRYDDNRNDYQSYNLSGVIFSDYGYEFQETMEAFLSAIDDPDQFGTVDSGYNSGAVTFDARVEIDGGFRRNGDNYGDVRSNSTLMLEIEDSYARNQGYDTIVIEAREGAYGYVEGNYAEVEFEWEEGTITFNGYIDEYSGKYYGTVYFRNYSSVDGGGGYSGTLGDFEVGVCDFFECR